MAAVPDYRHGLLVVGAAIVDTQGRLLAAERSTPAEYAGQWEFPGGKVEAGELPQHALIRECREELGIDITVGELLGEVPIAVGRLRVFWCCIVRGTPVASEHSALRWLAPSQLDDVPWIAADRPLVDALRSASGRPPS